MSRFEEIQSRLESLSPIPVNLPKLYLLGDTGAGKSTIVRKILGTEKFKFPSVQQNRTTVVVTEYVLCRDLPYKATYLFKTKDQILDHVSEILEIATKNAYKRFRENDLSAAEVAVDLEETPDEKFRLRYILTAEQLEELANEIVQFMPELDARVRTLCSDLQSNEGELDVVVDIAVDQYKEALSAIETKILDLIQSKVAEVCDGHRLFDSNYFQHSSGDLENFITKAKRLLSSTKDSISPVVEYARLQGNLLATWLPQNTELVLIDGEGIGHDTREASMLSARHLDYFHFADFVALVEESKKPFASGGKSVIEGVVRNGYLEKFILVFTKLDEVEADDGDGSNREHRTRAVKKGLKNVKNALKEDGVEFDIKDRLYYLSNMNDTQPDTDSKLEVKKLLKSIKAEFEKVKPQFVQPNYDYEMLSSYLSKSSGSFNAKWRDILNAKPWQTIKAFNRRMYWKWDEFRDMKPVSDFHSEVMKELDYFISHPKSWNESATLLLQQRSIARVKQEFSKLLLAFARTIILENYSDDWNKARLLSGLGSAEIRKKQIQRIFENVLPDHRKPEAIKMKDSIKQLLELAIEECKSKPARDS